MFNRGIHFRSLERFIYRKLGVRNSSADFVANIVGVFIDVKPATILEWPISYADSKTLHSLEQRLKALKLVVIFGDVVASDYREVFVAKSQKRANELLDAFHALYKDTHSPELDKQIGVLLGFPESAIHYYVRLHPEDGLSESHRASISRNRFYAHSRSHEDEEFESYETPIFRQLHKYCPRTAKFYQNSDKRWLD